jgi:hypothetical protein
MADVTNLVPFVVRFLRPVIDRRKRLILLRYETETCGKGTLGVRQEAISSLAAAVSSAGGVMQDREGMGYRVELVAAPVRQQRKRRRRWPAPRICRPRSRAARRNPAWGQHA